MTKSIDREALCERLARAFDIKPKATKHAAHEIAVTVANVDGQEFVIPLTLGQIVDALVPMIQEPGMDTREALSDRPLRKRWEDLYKAAENMTDDRSKNEALKSMVRESNLVEMALNRLIHESHGSLREYGWTLDDELMAVQHRMG